MPLSKNPTSDPTDHRNSHLPDVICGDLDSIRKDVTDFYRSKNVQIEDLSYDQDNTDLEKCIRWILRQPFLENDPSTIVAVGTLEILSFFQGDR